MGLYNTMEGHILKTKVGRRQWVTWKNKIMEHMLSLSYIRLLSVFRARSFSGVRHIEIGLMKHFILTWVESAPIQKWRSYRSSLLPFSFCNEVIAVYTSINKISHNIYLRKWHGHYTYIWTWWYLWEMSPINVGLVLFKTCLRWFKV